MQTTPATPRPRRRPPRVNGIRRLVALLAVVLFIACWLAVTALGHVPGGSSSTETTTTTPQVDTSTQPLISQEEESAVAPDAASPDQGATDDEALTTGQS